jgi:hypothetical protein
MASIGAGAAIAAGTASSMGSAGTEDSGAHIVRPELKMDQTGKLVTVPRNTSVSSNIPNCLVDERDIPVPANS